MTIGIEFFKYVGSAALLGAVIGYVIYSCRNAMKDLDAVIKMRDSSNDRKSNKR